MIVERAMHSQFLSNTYLVSDGAGGPAFFIDAGGPVAGLIETAERLRLQPTHVLLTHHHYDHVCEAEALRRHWPQIEVLIEPRERELLDGGTKDGGAGQGGGAKSAGVRGASAGGAGGAGKGATGVKSGAAAKGSGGAKSGIAKGDGEEGGSATGAIATGTIEAGETLHFGELEVRPLSTPGHTAGMLSFLVGRSSGAPRHATSTAPGGFTGGEAVVFTGDTLFKGSVGGVRAPGHTTCTELRDSIMGTLMELPAGTIIHPGHSEPTTVAREWEENAFIRIWRGVEPEGTCACTALGQPATLILLGRDYDGGGKAWVRWADGSDDIVPGSQVTRA
jgi:glyoxylase-like metal-dependent hydrolase (beta-lactamase superfamily II)